MLELLALRKGITLSKEMLLNHLYGGMDEPGIKIVDVFMCKLRKKLEDAQSGHPDPRKYIETIWGRGYVLKSSEDNGITATFGTAAKSASNGNGVPQEKNIGIADVKAECGLPADASMKLLLQVVREFRAFNSKAEGRTDAPVARSNGSAVTISVGSTPDTLSRLTQVIRHRLF